MHLSARATVIIELSYGSSQVIEFSEPEGLSVRNDLVERTWPPEFIFGTVERSGKGSITLSGRTAE